MEEKKSLFQKFKDFLDKVENAVNNFFKKLKKVWFVLNEKFKNWNLTHKEGIANWAKLIMHLLGGATIVAAALAYMYVSDVQLKNTVGNLFIGVILGLAAGSIIFLSESVREKPIAYLFLKVLSMVLIVLFVSHISTYASSKEIVEGLAYDPKKQEVAKALISSCYILGGVSFVATLANTVVNFILGIEE